jgi:hypothetical protein
MCAFNSLSAMEMNRVLGRSARAVRPRSDYEHIIRSGKEYGQIRKYILENPAQSNQDPENS